MSRKRLTRLAVFDLPVVAIALVVACGSTDQTDGDTATGGGSAQPGTGGGGASELGGSSTGGGATGGYATGGVATGGTSTGGYATGGIATGGTSTGGYATGGVATGGTSTGGAATGGYATGGIATGGTSTGGVGTGGTSTGGTAALGATGGATSGGTSGSGGTGGSAGGTGGIAGSTGGTGGSTAGSAGAGGAGATGGTGGGELTDLTIWIAGDSTVANGNTPCPAGWGKHFDPYFDDHVTVVNSAAGGRSVRTWLYSVQSVMDGSGECVLDLDLNGDPILQTRWVDMLDGMQSGDYLFIQFGINDGSATCDRHVGLEAFKESYGLMAQAATERGTQPIFVTPVSAIGCSGSTAVGTRGSYVTATIEAGSEYGVPVIDLHQLSVDLYNSLAFCPVPGGDVSASTTGPVGDFFCDDHTHFSDSGAVEIARLIVQALRDQGIGLSDYLL